MDIWRSTHCNKERQKYICACLSLVRRPRFSLAVLVVLWFGGSVALDGGCDGKIASLVGWMH
jgi:hypothetical protein